MSAKLVSTPAKRIQQLMDSQGFKQSDLARMTGIDKSSISLYLSGKYKPKGDKVHLIAKALHADPAFIMGFDTEPNVPSNIIPIPQMKKIPLLGTIACGEPILAEENIENYVIVDSESKVDFALKCKGDSMINARIFDGDIVYIHAQSDVENGQIAAVLIDNEATLKKVYKYPNKLVLSPCNPMYDDLVYTKEQLNDIRILGKAVIFVSTVR